MTRVSLTGDYEDRSVISKLNEMDKRVKENASVVTSAEASARQSAQSAQETADRFAGSVGAVVQNANAQINASKAEVDETVTTVAQAVQTAEGAVTTANAASASAQQSAQTVAGYNTRLTTAEGEIDTLQSDLNSVTLRVQTAEGDIVTIQGRVTALETADGQNVKINRINDYAVGLTGNQTDILGNKSFKGTIDFRSTASFSSNDFVSAIGKTIYSNTDADSTILEERQVAKTSADTIRFDTRNRMSKDGTNANRIETYLRTEINETTETVTLQLFILVYENNVQVRAKAMTIATLNATS